MPTPPGPDGHLRRVVGPFLEDLGFYRTFVHTSTEGIWRLEMEQPIDIHLTEDEQIDRFFQTTYLAECNNAFAQMNGASSPDEILGLSICDLFDREDAANLDLLRRMIRSGYQQTSVELTRQELHTTQKWFLYNCFGVVKNDAVVRAWGTQLDITEQKRNERIQAALYNISQATSSTQNLQELYRSIHQILGELMPANNLFIALYDPATNKVSFPYFVDEIDPPPSGKRLGRGLTEYVLRTGKPLLADPDDFEELARMGRSRTSVRPRSTGWAFP